MNHQNFHCSMVINVSAAEAVKNINLVKRWWNKRFEGNTENLGDTFSVYFEETYVIFKVTQIIPEKQLIWSVTDSNLHWLKNKKEWNGTKIIWEISVENGHTKIDFTHQGLRPGIECYDNCKQGWAFYVTHSLSKLIAEGKGMPDTPNIERFVEI
jgi:hypothetical protein